MMAHTVVYSQKHPNQKFKQMQFLKKKSQNILLLIDKEGEKIT